MYQWLSHYQQELFLLISSSSSALEMVYALLLSILLFPIDIICVFYFLIFGSPESLKSIMYIDAKIIVLSITLAGLFYRAFCEKDKINLNAFNWLLYRAISYLGAIFATLSLITYFTQTVSIAGIDLDRALYLSLSSYHLSGLLFVICLIYLLLNKKLKVNFFHTVRNGLGKGL